MKKIFWQIIFLLGLSAALSLVYNSVNSKGITLGLSPSSAQQEVAGFPAITLAQVLKIYRQPETVLLDARSQVEYNFGHIPGALNLPDDEFDKKLPPLADKLSRKKEIIVYCSGEGCGLSEHVAKKLKENGYGNIKLFVGGWPAWLQAGYPVDK